MSGARLSVHYSHPPNFSARAVCIIPFRSLMFRASTRISSSKIPCGATRKAAISGMLEWREGSIRMKLLLAILAASLLPAESISQGERDRAMSYLHATRKQFIDSLAGVSEAQWKWKPSPQVWSIAEVAEHIALSEDLIFSAVKATVAAPVDEAATTKTKGKDEMVMKMIVDRSVKAQAPEMLRPVNKWKSASDLTAHFKDSRDNTIEYVKTTTEDLRKHVRPHPLLKELDAYQWTLLIAGHCERHILQLNEVKTMPGYPTK